MQDKVTRLRQIMSEAIPAPSRSPEAAANDAYAYWALNAPQPVVVEQTAEARAVREIMRIANWYGWPGEITRALDAAGVTTLQSLGIDELESLLERMHLLEDCVHNGCDAPDAPPAR